MAAAQHHHDPGADEASEADHGVGGPARAAHPAGGHAHGGHSGGGHSHGGHAHGPATFGRAFAIGAIANGGFVAVQIACGVLAHSNALIADALHNLGDVLGLLLSWAAAWAGQRAPSTRRTYGWGRVSILAALINAVILLVGVGAIGIEAIRRLSQPAPVQGGLVMAVAALGIVINAGSAVLFARGRDDLNVRAAFLHLASDALVSLGVVVAGGLILLTGASWIDPLASLAIAAVILAATWSTLTQAGDLAVDAVPAGLSMAEVRACLGGLPGVLEVHDLHVWALSTTRVALTAHVVVAEPAPDLLILAGRELHGRFGIDHATLQLEDAVVAAACGLRSEAVI
jgi:cobalt-zinc-cadmium efflux system protein